MIRTHTLTIISVTCFSAAILGIGFLLSAQHLIAGYQRSYAKHRVAEVTAFACAIETFRAKHGHIPSAAELSNAAPQLARAMNSQEVTIILLPSSYVVEEVESGLDSTTKWRLVDGVWESSATGTPTEYLRQSEATVAACRRNAGRPPN